MFHGRNRLSESLPKEIVDQLEKLRQVERKLLKREPIECLVGIARLATSNPRHRATADGVCLSLASARVIFYFFIIIFFLLF